MMVYARFVIVSKLSNLINNCRFLFFFFFENLCHNNEKLRHLKNYLEIMRYRLRVFYLV